MFPWYLTTPIAWLHRCTLSAKETGRDEQVILREYCGQSLQGWWKTGPRCKTSHQARVWQNCFPKVCAWSSDEKNKQEIAGTQKTRRNRLRQVLLRTSFLRKILATECLIVPIRSLHNRYKRVFMMMIKLTMGWYEQILKIHEPDQPSFPNIPAAPFQSAGMHFNQSLKILIHISNDLWACLESCNRNEMKCQDPVSVVWGCPVVVYLQAGSLRYHNATQHSFRSNHLSCQRTDHREQIIRSSRCNRLVWSSRVQYSINTQGQSGKPRAVSISVGLKKELLQRLPSFIHPTRETSRILIPPVKPVSRKEFQVWTLIIFFIESIQLLPVSMTADSSGWMSSLFQNNGRKRIKIRGGSTPKTSRTPMFPESSSISLKASSSLSLWQRCTCHHAGGR